MRWSSRSPVAAWSTSNRTVPTSAIDVVGEAKLGSGAETTATNKADTRSDTFMREIVNPSMPPLCAPSMFDLLVQPNDGVQPPAVRTRARGTSVASRRSAATPLLDGMVVTSKAGAAVMLRRHQKLQ